MSHPTLDSYDRWKRSATFVPHEPWPRQKAFLDLDCLEALYGGAAGGGKSDALLMAALQYVHIPGYAALLLRRTYADLALPEAIMDRSKAWLMGSGAEWNDRDKRWTFPAGSTLNFGYMDTDRDRYRYQSAAFQFIGWDEATQFPESWYTYMFSRLRRPTSTEDALARVPLRMRGATNPGGIGHKWVKRRFIDPTTAIAPFVPAKLEDNPSVDQAAYLESLEKLDPTTRMQLRDGVWVQNSGGLVYGHFKAECVQPRPQVGLGWRFGLALDFGFDDATAFVVYAWAPHSRVVWILHSEKHRGMIPSAAAARVKELEKDWPFDRIVGDVGGLGKGYAEEMRQRWSIPIEAAEKRNKLGYIKLLNGAFANGELLISAGANDELVTELEELPWADEEHDREAEGFSNHLTDAMLYGWRDAYAFVEKDPPPPKPLPGTAEYAAAEEKRMWDSAKRQRVKQNQEWWKKG